MKIVINKKYGGFHLSKEAVLLYGEKKGLNIIAKQDDVIKDLHHYYLNEEKPGNGFAEWDIERTDPILIEVVEQLGDLANARYTKLKIVKYLMVSNGILKIIMVSKKFTKSIESGFNYE